MLVPLRTGGHTTDKIAPRATAASAVMIGTKRLPAKKPRYGGGEILWSPLNIQAARAPAGMPPNTPVSIDGMPMINFGVKSRTPAITPIVAGMTK